jgi:protein-tyrosine phosphatase
VIDLHCHLLPQIDDGSKSLAESLEMARLAVADGITITACTPHILPGVYDNTGDAIRAAVVQLQYELDRAKIPLILVSGADIHIAPDLLSSLQARRVPSLGDSRYFLLEPPKGIVPPRFEKHLFSLISAGYVPIITHPERLSWVKPQYDVLQSAVRSGAWTQLTAGSLVGRFGTRVRHLSERLLGDGLVHIMATDAHNALGRAPLLAEAFDIATRLVGRDEAERLVRTRPAGILKNASPSDLPMPDRCGVSGERSGGLWKRIMRVERI